MRAWLASALVFLLAVPFQTFWMDYEVARRGLLAVLVGLLCLFPGVVPRQQPPTVWAFNLVALWFLVRSFGVTNQGYAMEKSTHLLACSILVLLGSGMPLAVVLRATIPTGIVVGGWTIAQACGVAWFLPLPGVQEVTATLGNRNVAAEVLATCGAGAALLASLDHADGKASPTTRRLAVLTLAVCAVAVVINGSRSGLLALPLGCLPVLLQRHRLAVAGPLVGGPLVGGMALGWLLLALLPPPHDPVAPAVDAPGAVAAPSAVAAPITEATGSPTPSTVAVRLALWRGGLDMVRHRPLLGYGAGQFGTEYPPFRSATEAALSTFDHRFLAAPEMAHNDYLQLLIEGGLPALVGMLLVVWMVAVRVPFRHWGPLLAFGLLAFVRAPLTNAPAAAFTALLVGALLRLHRRDGDRELVTGAQRQLVKMLLLGGLLLCFGVMQLAAQQASTGLLRRLASTSDPEGQLASVEQARFWRPYDHQFQQLHAQAALRIPNLPVARQDIELLRRIRPHDTLTHWLWIELLRSEGKRRSALLELQALRQRDPYDAKAILWTAEIFVELEQSPGAVVLLYGNPLLRAGLATTLGALAKYAASRGYDADARLLAAEQAFIETIDLLAGHRVIAAKNAYQRFMGLLDPTSRDARPFVLGAALFVALNKRSDAETYAGVAKDREMKSLYLKMMEPILGPLRDIPAWRELLAR